MKLSTKLLVSHGVAATALLFAQLASAGTITGSAHDFSGDGWSGGEVCKTCHAPHNNLNAAGSLLWNSVWIVVGRQLGSRWQSAERWSELIELVVLGVAVVALVVVVVRSRRTGNEPAS